MDPPKTPGEMEWQVKQREYEAKKARAKALKLRLTCSICSEKAKLNCPCGTTQYCSTECQRIDWRDRGHRKACKKIRNERAAEAARAEAPTPPPEEVVYGPAPRSHADEVRTRIAAEHEAARARREANPEPAPLSARCGSRCPICFEDWDVNAKPTLRICCCRKICASCGHKIGFEPCPLCRARIPRGVGEVLVLLRRHVDAEIPDAITHLGDAYRKGLYGFVKSAKKAAKLYKRAVELGDTEAMSCLASLYFAGDGVKLDRNKGVQLLRIAADRGNAIAQCNLGNRLYEDADAMYSEIRNEFNSKGTNVNKSEASAKLALASKKYEESFRFYMLAARQGLTEAECYVATSFIQGSGVKQDISEGKRWFARAAAKGDEGAIATLNAF